MILFVELSDEHPVALSTEEPMSNQDFGQQPSIQGSNRSGRAKTIGQAASDTFSTASGLAQDAAGRAKQAASDTASTVAHQAKELLDRQVGSGAQLVGHLASSARKAAEELDQNAPQIAGLVHAVADRIENYAGELKDQSVDQLFRAASDLARRQPALVFGIAALGGFLAFRTLKSTPSVASPSIQPMHEPHRTGGSGYHGS
jgi:ElaB/YqjD/DUF883 family membrane-anchored ribosome-binding protein